MITITNHANGYKMLLSRRDHNGRGQTFQAGSVEEVHEAIDHYHAHGPNKSEHANNRRRDTCPICRAHKVKVDQSAVGRQARIIAVSDADNQELVGRTGTIKAAVKVHNVYSLADEAGKVFCNSRPENVEII
jgi:hypothetical protein